MPEALDPQRRAEIEYVTRNFTQLQGLKFVPVAAFFAVWAASETRLLQGVAWWVLFIASLVGLVAGIPTIGGWYRRRFGVVATTVRRDPDRRMVVAVIAVCVVAAAVVAAGIAGLLPHMPHVSWTGLLAGTAIAIIAWSQGPIARRVNPWLHRFAVAVAVTAAVPVGLIVGLEAHPLQHRGVMSFVFAGYFLVVAIGSHRGLVRLMQART